MISRGYKPRAHRWEARTLVSSVLFFSFFLKMQRQTNELLHADTRNSSCHHNPGADYRRQNPRGRGGYSQLSGFATVMMPYSSSPALVTKTLGYFWKVRTVSPPCHAQHTEINLICFPVSQTALQPVWGKAFLTVKLAGTCPAGLRQRKETKKLCLWNSVPQCSPARGIPTGLRCLPTVSSSAEQ